MACLTVSGWILHCTIALHLHDFVSESKVQDQNYTGPRSTADGIPSGKKYVQ